MKTAKKRKFLKPIKDAFSKSFFWPTVTIAKLTTFTIAGTVNKKLSKSDTYVTGILLSINSCVIQNTCKPYSI